MIEPGIAGNVARAAADWSGYGACSRCGAAAGRPCTALYTRIENGAAAGGPVELTVAHGSRRRRKRR